MKRALVVTASTRAAAGTWEDTSGALLVTGLTDLGYDVAGPIVVPDGEPVYEALLEAVSIGYDVVLTTGGTGFTPADLTPEMTKRLLDREAPGLAEAIRRYGVEHGVDTAVLSRGVAGLADRTLIVNLPGSSGGARDGLAVLAPLLDHLLDQIAGGDHARSETR
jgi:molybdenum cofactor synthesis domain-containing protein